MSDCNLNAINDKIQLVESYVLNEQLHNVSELTSNDQIKPNQ